MHQWTGLIQKCPECGRVAEYTEKENMTPTQRTGNLGARSTYRGKQPGLRLQPIFYHMTTAIQEATDDGRNYTVEIKVTANITVEPQDAEIGEYVHRDHFHLDPAHENMMLEPQDGAGRRVFEPTPQGYRRIE